MKFEDWLLHRGLKQSTADSYASAIRQALSRAAKEAGLSAKPLDQVSSADEFGAISEKLKQLPGFSNRNARGHLRYSNALDRFAEYLSDDVAADVEEVLADGDTTATEKLTLILSRVGQGIFRQRLLQHWSGRCAVTGYDQTSLLVASHIQPWRTSTNQERLNLFNGLLLLPNLDRAFDKGLISFDSAGTILISARLSKPSSLGITKSMRVKLEPEHLPFMKVHRSTFHLGDA